MRIINHLFLGHLRMRRMFDKKTRREISNLVKLSETKHSAEIVIAIEARLSIFQLLKKISPYKRAKDLFSKLNVWDTEQNNGVLIYFLLSDKKLQILSDRNVTRLAGAEQVLNEASRRMAAQFTSENIVAGITEGLLVITEFLSAHFPEGEKTANELSDETVII